MIAIIIIAFFIVFFILYVPLSSSKKRLKSDNDKQKYIKSILKKLHDDIGNIPELSSDTIIPDYKILCVASIASVASPESSSSIENYTTFAPENDRLWPHYYYSFPYNSNVGIWPPDMYARVRSWSPGNYMGTGWRYELRPGITYRFFPRNTWIRKGKNYFFLDNLDELKHNVGDYNKVLDITHY